MSFDLIIRGGSVYDGSGGPPRSADVAVVGDRIVMVDPVADAPAGELIDATGLAVAPGFINVLSHSYASILMDPRSVSELVQGVTTQIFGESESMGPLNEEMRAEMHRQFDRFDLAVEWTRLAEYLAHLERRGTSQNVASLIGGATPRRYVLGHENRAPTPQELDRMCALVDEEMADGALGIGSALIYAPGTFASTDELVAICEVASRHGGSYFSHVRDEGDRLAEAIDELIEISRRAQIPAEVWHLKATGRRNWPTMERVIERIERARAQGEPITADMYPYRAGATSLFACIPPAFHDRGRDALMERLGDPSERQAMRAGILADDDRWQNLYRSAGPDGIVLMWITDGSSKSLAGRSIAAIAEERDADPVDVLLDLLAANPEGLGAAYFLASEENLRRQATLPWVAFGSDAQSVAPEGRFLEDGIHPRSYGTFARVLGRFVREERLIDLSEAVRRMTSFPADTLGLKDRGRIAEGAFADVVVFDPDKVEDRATYDDPHQLAIGMRDVVVNGRVTLRDGAFTGTLAGRALPGRGKRS